MNVEGDMQKRNANKQLRKVNSGIIQLCRVPRERYRQGLSQEEILAHHCSLASAVLHELCVARKFVGRTDVTIGQRSLV
jgi:hypothetical protein